MSGAIWSEPGEPSAAHPTLGPIAVPSGALVAAAGRAVRTPVVLRAWGVDEKALQRALEVVRFNGSYNTWHITDTRTQIGPVCPLHADASALAQGTSYGWAWSVYPAPTTKENA